MLIHWVVIVVVARPDVVVGVVGQVVGVVVVVGGGVGERGVIGPISIVGCELIVVVEIIWKGLVGARVVVVVCRVRRSWLLVHGHESRATIQSRHANAAC